ncbi:hypothetical protein JEQ12_017952 [Ovis aries]|uniref:Ig-like domain-containing protein n=1 Tax=Ovis aries TaxID=9940 RepID=A0A836CZX3_SHEEP|nr:hypothetical protein JEQ12_017952 [Ovis aries]
MRLVIGVTVFLTLGTVIDAKTTQPSSMDCAEEEEFSVLHGIDDAAKQSVMKRQVDTVLGLLFAQVCWEIIQKRLHSVSFHCSATLLLLISILGMIFAPRDSRGQSLTQPDDPVLVSEGTSLELKCNYSYGATPYVFWAMFLSKEKLICNCYQSKNWLTQKEVWAFLHVKSQERYSGDTLEMSSSPGLVTVMLFLLGQTRGDSVSQMDGQVTLLEGAPLTVNCTYSAIGYPTLFWYVQYAGEAPELLLKATKANDKGTNEGFEATYDAKTTSFHLEKASVQESDSAVYHCAE